MDFDELFANVCEALRREQRISYRALRRRFELSDEDLEDLKVEIIEAKQLAVDENDRILVWIGETGSAIEPTASALMPELASPPTTAPEQEPLSYTPPHLAKKILTTRSALEGERKQVTVLFCDLANSTVIAEQIGPENMHALLNRFFELALSEVHRYEGTINQFLGDGLMALFGAPIAHEDHARRGVLSALSLQRTLKEADLGKPYGVECAFRMGLNSGLVVVGSIGDNLRMDYSAIGDTTNLAYRLQQAAEPGEILISANTGRLVQGSARLEALQPVEMKGKTEPVPIYKVVGILPQRSPIVSRGERRLSPFVGRERELAVLDERLKLAESGQGQIVGVVAEAGKGKSRLLYEFRQKLQDKRVAYLEGRCLSYGHTVPYHPIIDIVRHHCRICETDSPTAIHEKVRHALQEIGMEPTASAPYLLRLLGVQEGTEPIAILTPEAVRIHTFDTLKQMSLKGSQQRPLVFEIEDLHWIDNTSQDYLASLVESLTGASILLLTTYRPGYHPQWLDKSYATQILLRSLTRPDALTIVHSICQDAELPERLEQTIVAKAEGNPFFLEELTRAVVEHGDFQAAIVVPDTIQGVLSARIDRLPAELKWLLQTASVLGREFSTRLLKAIWDQTDMLEPLLLELKRLEFLYERTDLEEPVYGFKHVLTQDVAYESLLKTRRQTLHAAAGQAVETSYPEGLIERYEELAHHFTRGEVWEKAFAYLVKSGEKARQAYANPEAIALYTQAIEVSQRSTPALDKAQLLSVYEGRGLVRLPLTQYDEAIADFKIMRQLARTVGKPQIEGESLWLLGRAHLNKSSEDQIPFMERYAQEGLRLAQRTGDQKILARSLTSLGLVHVEQRNLREALETFEEAVQISRQEGDKGSLYRALTYLCMQHYFQGKFQAARPLAEEGATVSRDLFDSSYELLCLGFLCQAHWSLGHYGKALAVADEMSTKSQAREHIFYLSRSKNTLGWFYRELGDISRAVEYDRESVELRRTIPIANAEISALVNLGLDYLALGQYEHSQSHLKSTLERVQREGFGSHRWRWTIRLLIGLAELSYTTGDYEQALRYVEDGLKEAQRTSSQKYVALGWALRGKIIAKLGDAKTAGTKLQRAFTLAEQLQSPSLIYPIAYDLGQWHENAGHEREASALYGKAKMTIEQMATAVEDEALRSTFLQSALVQEIHEHATRLDG